MRKTLLMLLLTVLMSGCASRFGELEDGREYHEYHIKFDKEQGRFYIPLEQKAPEADSAAQPQP